MAMQIKDISVFCEDHFELAATVYRPDLIKGAVMIAPATGIKRRFYHAFATHLAESGYGTITFDNRGIGDSKGDSIDQGNPSLINWGKLDMSAVLEHLKSCFSNQAYHLVGHSAGGQLAGLMTNSSQFRSMFNFGASSGSIRHMKYPFKLSAIFYLNFFIPVSNYLLGKTNSQWVGMGEPLPKEVADQWTKWCNGTGYVATEFGKKVLKHSYDELDFPALWLHATDDPIANLKNVEDMIRVYSKSRAEIISIVPKEIGLEQLGHMGFFSKKNRVLWKYAIDWLRRNEEGPNQ